MRRRTVSAFLFAPTIVLWACSEVPLETEEQKASYGIGLEMGTRLVPAGDRLDIAAFRKGIDDAMSGADPAIPQDELQAAVEAFSQSVIEATNTLVEELARVNTEAGQAYLAENATREGVMSTPSGLQYEVLREGSGPRPSEGDTVRLHFKGTLVDGTEFDSSYDGEPAEYAVQGVIPGFAEALKMMSVGSHYRITVPTDLAYGTQGMGRFVGPNAVLIFEIELLEIVQ